MLSNGTIDGFIVSVSESSEKSRSSRIINVMELNSDVWIAEGVDCDKVIVDDFDSARNATQHYWFGAKNIALISSIDNLSVGKLDGYLKA
jgi:LacI family transcriptional regulator